MSPGAIGDRPEADAEDERADAASTTSDAAEARAGRRRTEPRPARCPGGSAPSGVDRTARLRGDRRGDGSDGVRVDGEREHAQAVDEARPGRVMTMSLTGADRAVLDRGHDLPARARRDGSAVTP